MATLFGEIVEPTSRAFLDDDDFENDKEVEMFGCHNPNDACFINCECDFENFFAVSWIGEKPNTKVQTFVVTYGRVTQVFAKQYLLGETKPVGVIEWHKKNEAVKEIGHFHHLSDDILACIILSNLPGTDAASVVEVISDLLADARQVFAITSLPRVQFLSHCKSQLPEGFLRKSATNPPPENINIPCPNIEIPNTIIGFPAGVLTWCQCEKLKCCLVICYSEDSCGMIDSITIAPLLSLLSCEPFSKLPAASKSIKKTAVTHQFAGNLYM